jgi:hypothetical protein
MLDYAAEPEGQRGDELPFLSILQVIDTSGFAKEGDKLVGIHPILEDQASSYLEVDLASNSWHYAHEGSEIGGDPWLWLACECGAVAWVDSEPDLIDDDYILTKVLEYVVEKGLLKQDELFREETHLNAAIRLIFDLKEKVLKDPGLPFERKYIDAFSIIMTQDQPEFERLKAYFRGKVSWREIYKKIKDASINVSGDDESSQESSSVYISWQGKRPQLMTGPLLEDILTYLNARVIEGTEKDLAIYNPKTGTYDIGKSAMRLILSDAIRRIKLDGDPSLECLSPRCISVIRSLAPVLALEVGKEFETLVSHICVGNGVVDLKASHVIEWSPDWYMVQHTTVKYVTAGRNWLPHLRRLLGGLLMAIRIAWSTSKDTWATALLVRQLKMPY